VSIGIPIDVPSGYKTNNVMSKKSVEVVDAMNNVVTKDIENPIIRDLLTPRLSLIQLVDIPHNVAEAPQMP
jgi:hypothetical protein